MSTPQTTLFAVRGLAMEQVAERLEAFDITSLSVAVTQPVPVVVVGLANCNPDPQQALIDVRERLGSDGNVQRVLQDAHGYEVLPTGTIQVRFKEQPSDDGLTAFGESLGLKVVARNAFQPKQASFEAADAKHANLEADIGRVEQREEVRRVWPEVLSKYTRSSAAEDG